MVCLLVCLLLVPPGEASQPAAGPRLATVNVEPAEGEQRVRLGVIGDIPRYRITVLDQPARIAIDLHGVTLAWAAGPLRPPSPPVREVRGSQWRRDVARVVVELTERVPYRVEPVAGGLLIVLHDPAPRGVPPMAREPQAGGEPRVGGAPVPPAKPGDEAGGRVAPAPPAEATVGQGRPADPTLAQAPPADAEAVPPSTGESTAWSVRGHVEAGGRFFLNERDGGLVDDNVLLEGRVDFRLQLDDTELRLHPRLAIDPTLSSRNRYEPLDAYLEHSTPTWALLVGQAVENWAIVDTFNPADVLSRRDLERDFYDPERLGELMVRFRYFLPDVAALEQPALSLYLLPLHRETPLPSNRDRFRLDATGDNRGDLRDDAIVPSPDVAYAARLSATLGQADLFLFYFGGPSRIPSFELSPPGDLTPVYYLVDMVGGGVQWALGRYLFKLEAAQTFTKRSGLRRSARDVVPDDFFQYVVGVDRTFFDVLGRNEVTITLEYAGEDDPGDTDLTGLRPYKSDVFVGVRWAFNDPRRTELQVSVAADVRVDEQLWLVRFVTTLYKDLRLVLGGQLVNRAPDGRADRFTTFNVFPNNSNVHVGLRYEF